VLEPDFARLDRLVIPESMRPRDGRFGSGPSKIRSEQLEAVARAGRSVLGTSHRQKPVKTLVRRIRDGLTELFDLPEGYEVVLSNGGAAAFWDVITAGLIEQRIAHQVCGEFSGRFAAVTQNAPFLLRSVVDRSDFGTRPAARSRADVDAYAWTQNETSTGVMSPVARPEGATPQQLTIVDATSSAGAMKTDFSQADAYYFSPQKTFASDGGLWFAILSPDAVERANRVSERVDRWIPPFLSLTDAIANSRQNQTYNTPALTSLVLMAEQVDWLNLQGGLDWSAERSRTSSSLIYEWAAARSYAHPFVDEPAERSTVTCVISIDDSIGALALARVLRNNGIVDIEPYRTIGTQQIRIATFPSIDPDDVRALLASIDWTVERMATP
jgi:phosphoserine aminotransferase